MEDRALFVDFMYAVTVGTALPRLDAKTMRIDEPALWGILLLLAVFLEDFYLYHIKVLPHLHGFPHWRGFILAMAIIVTWYISQAAFPEKPRVFLASFALFFLLKLVGGLLMHPTQYPTRQDAVFLLPVAAALICLILMSRGWFSAHPGRLIMVLAPAWVLTVILWWSIDAKRGAPPAQGDGTRNTITGTEF